MNIKSLVTAVILGTVVAGAPPPPIETPNSHVQSGPTDQFTPNTILHPAATTLSETHAIRSVEVSLKTFYSDAKVDPVVSQAREVVDRVNGLAEFALVGGGEVPGVLSDGRSVHFQEGEDQYRFRQMSADQVNDDGSYLGWECRENLLFHRVDCAVETRTTDALAGKTHYKSIEGDVAIEVLENAKTRTVTIIERYADAKVFLEHPV